MINRYSYYYRKGKIKTIERFSPSTPHLVSLWLESVRKHPYFNEFECYLFGSLLYQDESVDMDIFFTGELKSDKLVDLMDYSLLVAFDLNIKADIFYIPDYSFLDFPAHFHSNSLYDVFTTYDHEMLIEDGKIVLFRDYGLKMDNGLFKMKMTQYHKKSVDRDARGERYKRLK